LRDVLGAGMGEVEGEERGDILSWFDVFCDCDFAKWAIVLILGVSIGLL